MCAYAADAPELNDRGQEKSFLYDAFISYNHRDRPVAQGVQRGLQRIGRRAGQLRALRVFRDSTDLTASPDLWGKVTEAMDRSRFMIAVLSPSAASAWVNKELAYWLARRDPDQLLLVVAGGQLTWDEDGARFDLDRSDAAPPLLTQPGVLRPSRSTSTSAMMHRGIPQRRCSGRRSPTWPPRSTGNPNTNWRARICASNAGSGACGTRRLLAWPC